MDGYPFHRIVHFNGRIYEVPRRRRKTQRKRAIWVWQGTFSGGGHKRETWRW